MKEIINERFEILDSIGGGGMGQIYLALDQILHREIALKVIKSQRHPTEDERAQFLEEARAIAALKHPNTVRVFDHGYHTDEDGLPNPFITMELIEGKTLGDVLKHEARQRMPVDQAVEVALQIADSIAEAHGRGILHRDLKPGNIMLTRVGRFASFVKVLDFGLALRFSTGTDSPESVLVAGIAGTPGYMAPEQLGGRLLDARCDVYSLGVLLFEMISGCMPLSFSTLTEMALALRDQTPPPLDCACPGVRIPPLLVELVRQCLEKEPRERPVGMRTVLDILISVREQLEGKGQPEALQNCPKCKATAPVDAGFCSSCGIALGATDCPGCGTANSAADRFCSGCGNSLTGEPPTDPAPPPPSRVASDVGGRQLRFCALLAIRAESLEVSSMDSDPHELFERQERFTNLVADVASRHRGNLAATSAHDILVVFGGGTAHERQASAALAAALELGEALSVELDGFSRDGDRLALASGLVMLRERPGAPGFGAVGEAALNARAMLLAEEEGRILADYATFRQVRWECLHGPLHRSVRLPGSHRVVTFVEIQGKRDQGGGFGLPSEAQQRGRLVGRQAQLAQLNFALERLLEDQQLAGAIVTGRSGIGKTRLVHELLKSAAELEEPLELRYFDCSGFNHGLPLEPFLSDVLLRCGVEQSDGESRKREKIFSHVRSLALESCFASEDTSQLVAQRLAHLTSGAAGAGKLAPTRSFSATADEDLSMDAVATFYEWAASSSPQLMVLDNIDDMSVATTQLLNHLCRRLSMLPVMIVATCKDEARLSALQGTLEQQLSVVRLQPLRTGEVTALLQELTRGLGLPPAVVERVGRLSGGNPLFLQEITESLREAQAQSAPGGRAREEAESDLVPVPPTLESLMQARIDRLSEEERDVLTIAAVIGEVFWEGGVASLLDRTVTPALDGLARTGFVRVAPFSMIHGERQFSFSQQLLRLVLHERLPKNRRSQMHGQVAAWLESVFEPDQYELTRLIASHYVSGGNPAAAVPFQLQFAQVAESKYANDEALDSYQAVVEIVGREPGLVAAPERFRNEYLPAVLGAGRVARRTGRHELSRKVTSRALELVRHMPAPGSEDEFQPGEAALGLAFALGEIEEAAGKWPAALKYFGMVRKEIAPRRSRHPTLWPRLCAREGATLCWLGRLDEAIARVEDGLSFDALEPDQEVELRMVLAGCRYAAGELDAAAQEYETCQARYRQDSNLVGEGGVLSNLAAIAVQSGDIDSAERSYQESIGLHARAGYRRGQSMTLCNLGELYVDAGRFDKALDVLAQARKLSVEIGSIGFLSEISGFTAKAHMGLGNHAQARLEAAQGVDEALQAGSEELLGRARKVNEEILGNT